MEAIIYFIDQIDWYPVLLIVGITLYIKWYWSMSQERERRHPGITKPKSIKPGSSVIIMKKPFHYLG